MSFDETVRILQAAQGDAAKLGLASMNLVLTFCPETDRANLRYALEIAAVPRWFDEEMLGRLLSIDREEERVALIAKLRSLPMIEPFPAHGAEAWCVHRETRLGLRKRLHTTTPNRF